MTQDTLVITHMFKCDCIDPVFFHRRGRKARREGIFDYLCDLCALSGEMWVITTPVILDTGTILAYTGVSGKQAVAGTRQGGLRVHLQTLLLRPASASNELPACYCETR